MIVAKISSIHSINIPCPNSYNKAHKIIIKLNDKSAARALDHQSPKDIVENINQYVKSKNITDTDIRAAQKLKSDDIIIYTVNDAETKNLLEN